jgi:NAD(P)H-nitrite reductase large subunit
MTRYVILGAGPAGLNAIEAIRRTDSAGPITLVSGEPAYARMALPYFVAGEIPRQQLATGSDEYFERLSVDARFGVTATSLDEKKHSVGLDDGSTLEFDKLLIATGSSPSHPPIPGSDGTHVHSLWTVADADAVLAAAPKGTPSAVLVGAGFIGLIVLNAMHKRGWKLTLIEREGRILPRMLDRKAADAAEAWLRERGIDVYTGVSTTEITGKKRKALRLSDGQSIESDLVILATGIRPNLAFLNGSDVRVDGGVVVDQHCESSVPGIYAAGDAAAGPNLLGGPAGVHAIQTTAVDHGRIAGANMAGAARDYPGSLVMNILDLAGLHLASFGRWHEDEDTTVVWAPGRSVYRKLVWDGTRLVGAIVAGPVEDTTMLTDVGMIKGLIQAQTELGTWKDYLQDKPWDLRRPYVASRTATSLLPQTIESGAARPRGYTHGDRQPSNERSPYHADIVGTRPAGFEDLPRTPTPGIYKKG